MAKKKKKKTTARRVGGSGLSKNKSLITYGSIAAGFLLGDKINAAIDKATGDKIDSKIIAAGQAGIGALLVFKKKAKPNIALSVVGGIALGSGVKRAMKAFGIGGLGGYQMVPAVGGYQNVHAVGNGSGNRKLGYSAVNGNFSSAVPGRRTVVNGSGSGLMSAR